MTQHPTPPNRPPETDAFNHWINYPPQVIVYKGTRRTIHLAYWALNSPYHTIDQYQIVKPAQPNEARNTVN